MEDRVNICWCLHRKLFSLKLVPVLKITPEIGHFPAENFLCTATFNILPFNAMANNLNFVDIYFFLTVNILQEKKVLQVLSLLLS